MKRILLVEDQLNPARYLAKGLGEAGMAVDVANTGPDGLHQLLTVDYDLAILDIQLPGLDGFTILETARKAGRSAPVLFLTARDEVDDKVRGLEAGADDYLVKPYSFAELLARVRVLLRRHASTHESTPKPTPLLVVGDLTLDQLKRRVTRNGVSIDLSAKEFALLQHLMSFAGEVQSRTVLAARVWNINFDSDSNVVEVAMSRLRAKVDDPFASRLLHTVRGVGYVLDHASP